MNTFDAKQFAAVRTYLDRLDGALWQAPADERTEIVGSVAEHINQALGALPQTPTEADVATTLTTLGPVEDVIAAWRGQADQPASPVLPADPVSRPQSWWVSPAPSIIIAVVALLTALPLFFIGGPLALANLIYVVIVLRSRRGQGGNGSWWLALILSAAALVAFAVVVFGLIGWSTWSDVQVSFD